MKKMKTPNLVTLVILTTITVTFWIFFSVYRVFASKPSISVPPEILEPISPNLDLEALEKIEQGVYLPEEQIPNPTASPEATPAGLEQGT